MDLNNKKKILWTSITHLGLIVLAVAIFLIPTLFTFVRDTTIGFVLSRGKIPLGILLVALPTITVIWLWKSTLLTGKWQEKVVFGLWVIFNLFFTIAYLVVIDNYLK